MISDFMDWLADFLEPESAKAERLARAQFLCTVVQAARQVEGDGGEAVIAAIKYQDQSRWA